MKTQNVSQKLISAHLISGEMIPGIEIGLKIDQVLLQDATGTLVMLELEAFNLKKAKPEIAVQYVDHNLLQTDYKNMDDHLFLQSAAARFGFWFSRTGNGISHVVHMERFGRPGKTLLGSDSHTPAGGGIGMLAIGTGGLDVALAAAGEPYYVKMPKIMGIKLIGKLPDWVSAKDVVLEMLRRYDVTGGRGYILEYYGPGLKTLSAWDRHVIANMGTELGATTSVFPSDEITREFLKQEEREDQWINLEADSGATYDKEIEIDLSAVEPLIALPGSPGDVVTVREVSGLTVNQVVIGSSANPGLRDFWIVSQIVKGNAVSPEISFDVNPSSRQVLENLMEMGALGPLIAAGARLHQSGCMGCIGMGQAPATNTISLRTMPRNFPGRSGTLDDKIYLCSPETAAAAALTGKITDPRDLETILNISYPQWKEPAKIKIIKEMLIAPNGGTTELIKGPNIKSLPLFDELPDTLEVPILLKMGDDISTDGILKAGAEVLPLRSNIPEISKYSYYAVDPTFYDRAIENQKTYEGYCVIAGNNYAQGSSREHAALAPKYLGQKFAIAKSYARIGWQNLINFGIVPFEFKNAADWDKLEQGDILQIEGLRAAIKNNDSITATVAGKNIKIILTYTISERQAEIILKGGVINLVKHK
ncbi:aconitate hydratase [uncultured Flavobacterium sp.]|uniref:aconitate hydratase n=1 Tax=uncultured Flavobacterium sp. TaxID=165435 RepID=UPI0030ECE0DC|tara:strand:- start:143 stop:2089 length:1947 start_codon:yes stop_codon:yes gene_type:complete